MRFVRVAEVPGARVARRAQSGIDAAPVPAIAAEPRTCPECGVDLEPIRIDARHVDYCPDCHGMWLSRDAAAALVVRRSYARWHPAQRADDPPVERAVQLRLVTGGGGVH